MRLLRSITALLLVFCALAAAAQNVMTSITATSVNNGTATITGKLCLTPADQYGTPIAVTKYGGGFFEKNSQFCQTLTAGALAGSLAVPDSSTDSRPGHGYNMVVYDTVNRVSTDPMLVFGIATTVWSLDTYAPGASVPTTSAFTFTMGSSAPVSACTQPALYVEVSGGVATLYVCSSGAWVAASGGGGGGSTPPATQYAQGTVQLPTGAASPATLAAVAISGSAADLTGLGVLMHFKGAWSSSVTYDVNDVVADEVTHPSIYFISLAGANLNHTPAETGTIWWEAFLPPASSSYGGSVILNNGSTNTTAENAANRGANSGYAELDSGGKVPSGEMPTSIGNGAAETSLYGNGTTNGIATAFSTLTSGGFIQVPSGYPDTESAPGYTAWANGTRLDDFREASHSRTYYNWGFGNAAIYGHYLPESETCHYDTLVGDAATPELVPTVGCNELTFDTLNIGHDYGVKGSLTLQGWTISLARALVVNEFSAGINNGRGMTDNCLGIGDCNPDTIHVYTKGGYLAGSDEGTNSRYDHIHLAPVFTATVASVSNSATRSIITMQSPGGRWLGVGQHVINLTTGVITGTASAGGSGEADGALTFAVSSPSTTMSASTCGTLTSDVNTPNHSDGATVSMTGVDITTSGTFNTTNNTVLSGQFIEQERITSAAAPSGGHQIVTIPLIYGFSAGTRICQGGVVGHGISFSTPSGAQYVQWILAVPSTNTLTIGENVQGGIGSRNPGGALSIYQNAIAIDVQNHATKSVDGGVITTDLGASTWSNNDAIEMPNNWSMRVSGHNNNLDDVSNPYAEVVGQEESFQSPYYHSAHMFDGQGVSNYGLLASHGGWGYAPIFAHLRSVFGGGLYMNYAPEGAAEDLFGYASTVIAVGPFASGSSQTNYDVLELGRTSSGYDILNFNPSTEVLYWDSTFQATTLVSNSSESNTFTTNTPSPAVSWNNNNSGTYAAPGTYWDGSASAVDTWTRGSVLGSGTNPSSIYAITHTGSPGAVAVSVPGLIDTAQTGTVQCAQFDTVGNLGGTGFACGHHRVLALSANSATPAVNTDNYDVVHITAQTATITGFTVTGTPADGDALRISVTGTASVPFTLGSSFEASTVTLPTTTSGTARLDMSFIWNSETSKWRIASKE